MKFAPIESKDFPLWKQMRMGIYGSLSDEHHEAEMQQIVCNDDWLCRFLADEHNQIIGLVELSSRNIVDGCLSSPVAYLEGLYLKPQYRGKGYGKETIELVLNWCNEKGYTELATDTELTNIHAQGFYHSLGFLETDRVVEYRIDVKKT